MFNYIKVACAIWCFVCILAGIPLGILANVPQLSVVCTLAAIIIVFAYILGRD